MLKSEKKLDAEQRKCEQRQFDRRLLLQVSKFPYLFDVKSKGYHSADSRTKCWKEICEYAGGETPEDCKHRFQYLRGEYTRFKQALKAMSEQAAEAKLKNSGDLYKQMSFLDPHITSRRNRSKYVHIAPVSSKRSAPTNTTIEMDSVSNRSGLGSVSSTSYAQPTSIPLKRPRLEDRGSDNQVNTLLSAYSMFDSSEDECSLFSKTLAEGLRYMPQELRQFAMFKLRELMYQLQAGIVAPPTPFKTEV